MKQTNYLIWTVNLLACVGLGFASVSCYKLFVKADPDGEASLESQKVPPPTDQNVSPVSVDTDQILKSQLFKRSEPSMDTRNRDSFEMSSAMNASKGSKIDLPLKLIGTIAGDAAVSMAIIEETNKGQQGVYVQGDTLLEAKIEDIRQNQVVLLLAGDVRYILDLSVSDSSKQSGSSSGAAPVTEKSVRADEVVREISPSEVIINAQARNVAKHHLSRVMDSVSLRTVSEKGKRPGVQITGLPESLMGRLIGLNNGDVIYEINDHPVENARKASQVLKKARSVGTAKVLFSRGDKEQTLVLHTGLW